MSERDSSGAEAVSGLPNPPDDSDRLLPCPFCDGTAEICEAAECGPDAYVVACLNRLCLASSAVIFAHGDDPRPLLMERWNRRALNGRASLE